MLIYLVVRKDGTVHMTAYDISRQLIARTVHEDWASTLFHLGIMNPTGVWVNHSQQYISAQYNREGVR